MCLSLQRTESTTKTICFLCLCACICMCMMVSVCARTRARVCNYVCVCVCLSICVWWYVCICMFITYYVKLCLHARVSDYDLVFFFFFFSTLIKWFWFDLWFYFDHICIHNSAHNEDIASEKHFVEAFGKENLKTSYSCKSSKSCTFKITNKA